jgi:hypothetical protein
MTATQLPRSARALRAALAWHGSTIELLAEAMAERANQPPERPALSASTLYAVQQGRRHLRPWEIAAISELLNVPEWFLRDGMPGADDAPVTAQSEDVFDQALEEIAAVLERLVTRVSEQERPSDAATTRRTA